MSKATSPIAKECLKRLKKEYLTIVQSNNPQVEIRIDETNMLRWYFLLKNLDKPYKRGYYMGVINYPKAYPMKAPTFEFITPNGRFNTNEKICTTFSHYHPESWSPSWTTESLIVGLISFMMEDGTGVGSIKRTKEERKKLAKGSIEFNVNNSIFQKAFPDYEFKKETDSSPENKEKE